MYLDTYFDPAKINLGSEFGIKGLKPVLRNTLDDTFLLKDDENYFYLWNENDKILNRITPNTMRVETAVEMAIVGVPDSDLLLMADPRCR